LFGHDFTGDDVKERVVLPVPLRLQPDVSAGRHRHRGVVEQDAAADPIGEVGDYEHGMSSPTPLLTATCRPARVQGRHGKQTRR
jgi:hypothetical protein